MPPQTEQPIERPAPGGQGLPEVFYDPRALEPAAEKRACLHAKCVVVDASPFSYRQRTSPRRPRSETSKSAC
ncbi:MAG TPA: hypothetical protein VF278_21555 [Pirellulales bacterium]